MKSILNKLFDHKRLTSEEAKEVLIQIAQSKFNSAEIAAFMTVFLMRPIAVEELRGFREALMDLAVKIDLSDFNTIDLCGTGGDGKNTFNISTLTSFILAGADQKVAKHGNYGVSSSSGSSNMLAHMGYNFSNDQDQLKRELDQAGICFLHAPLFHPAMKVVAPIRKELGVKTFFNMLGPLVNPARPQNQFVGVYSLEVARAYNYMLQESGQTNYGVVYSLDGYDEISLTGNFKLLKKSGEQLLSPEDLGLNTIAPESIYGGSSVAEAAAVFKTILEGEGSLEQNNVVLANAAMALSLVNPAMNFETAFEKAEESLLSGKAKQRLGKLIELSN